MTYDSIRPVGLVPDCELPRNLKANWQPFRIHVGGGTKNRSACVVTGLEQALTPGQSVSIKLNGVDCPEVAEVPQPEFPPHVAEAVCRKIPEGLLHDGDNIVHIHLNTGETRAVWCEIAMP